ncbi:unnamed protein product [Gongylonema pulchrum]|uniref:Peptidase S1 domain-containing protein n=1 Tax=Gongylonema pulchrum TaxID=637853 RepID=A0A183E8M9_9BILA|nr:unnamed protein product [Gongylonema pulchrum]
MFQGDSGGGVMAQLYDGRWVLLGIHAVGHVCQYPPGNYRPILQGHTSVALHAADIARFTGLFLPLVHV